MILLEESLKKILANAENIRKSLLGSGYSAKIIRQAPKYKPQEGTISVDTLQDFIVKSDISLGGVGHESTPIGSSTISTIGQVAPLEVELTFIEVEGYSFVDFLQKNNGIPILPKDGTYLLPYEYYFNIEVKDYKGTILIKTDFELNGGISIAHSAEANELLLMSAKFTPIHGNI